MKRISKPAANRKTSKNPNPSAPPAAPSLVTRALSITQPMAGLVVKGIKPVENRTWGTNYRGLVAIHASGKFYPSLVTQLEDCGVPLRVPSPANDRNNWPTRAILGVAEIADCIYYQGEADWDAIIEAAQEAGILPARPTKNQVHNILFWMNIHCFVWIIKNPIEFKQPIPANGKLNLWHLSDEQREAVERAVAATTGLRSGGQTP